MRYWLSNGDGKTYGPYELEQLRALASEGRLAGPVQLCAEGSTQWVPASSVVSPPGGAMSAPPAAPPQWSAGAHQAWTPVSLVGPILCTLCCCLPGGICAIVFASKANAKGAAGDIEGARREAATSKQWLIWSVVLGLIANALFVILQVAAASSSGRY